MIASDLSILEIGIAGIEKPTTAVFKHGNAGMAPGMPCQRDEKDFGREALKIAYGVETKPRLATAQRVERPVRCIVPLLGTIAFARHERTALAFVGDLLLACGDVYACVGEILNTACVIEIEMCDDDVPDVAWIEAKPTDLRNRGFLGSQLRPVQRDKEAGEAIARSSDILRAIARIDEHQAIIGLDQKAVAYQVSGDPGAVAIEQVPADGAARATIEMVNLHAYPLNKYQLISGHAAAA